MSGTSRRVSSAYGLGQAVISDKNRIVSSLSDQCPQSRVSTRSPVGYAELKASRVPLTRSML
jgi:hypothetical protein